MARLIKVHPNEVIDAVIRETNTANGKPPTRPVHISNGIILEAARGSLELFRVLGYVIAKEVADE